VVKDHRERRSTAVRELIGSADAIVLYEPPKRHGLHRLREDFCFASRPESTTPRSEITRSCALSLVVALAMGYSRRQLLANAAIAASRVGS
jgi:hypothetical protein